MIYIRARGAGELAQNEAELERLTTPPPKNEAESNRVRMADAKRLREHIAAVRAVIYPPDEPEASADA